MFQKILSSIDKKKTWLKKSYFSVDYSSIDADDILDIHKYLLKKHNIK